jgi:hypothetical protein
VSCGETEDRGAACRPGARVVMIVSLEKRNMKSNSLLIAMFWCSQYKNKVG